MITWFAVLISGVLLNPMDAPMPKLRFAFMSGAGTLIWAVTDENGTFSVDLAPGTYRVRIGPELGEQVTVDESTSKVKLHRRAPAARVRLCRRLMTVKVTSLYRLAPLALSRTQRF